jgi:hypothetical protein
MTCDLWHILVRTSPSHLRPDPRLPPGELSTPGVFLLLALINFLVYGPWEEDCYGWQILYDVL